MKKKKISSWLKLLLIILTTFAIFYGSVQLIAYAIPIDEIDQPYHIEFYDDNNELIVSFNSGYIGDYIEYDSINPKLILAFINVEDKNFFSHSGLDYLRIVKAFFVNFKEQDISQGGSTITQQLARTIFLDNQKSLERKIGEAFRAIQIEQRYSKTKILETYLNTVFFGENLYGIESASTYYFNKSQDELTLAEACVIAGLLNSPNTYIEDSSNQKIIERQKKILESLLQANKITIPEYQEAMLQELVFYKTTLYHIDDNLFYYLDACIQQLTKQGLYSAALLRKGLKVYTNLNRQVYSFINNAMKSQLQYLADLQASIVMMQPYTNKVTALLGGKDYRQSAYNRPLNAYRQIGSTVKPLLYYLSLVNGFSPLTKLYSEPTTFYIENYGEYAPANYGNSYPNRQINMLEAIATSDNIYAVKSGLYLGSASLASSLSYFGDKPESVPSLFLGTNEMNLLQLTNMYNTFASEGMSYSPSFVRFVVDYQEQVLYQDEESETRLLIHPYTLVLNQMLRAPFDKNLKTEITPTMYYYQTKGQYSAKSGSTYSDNYVMAFNPLVTIGIWCGNDEGSQIINTSIAKVLFKLITTQIDNNIGLSWYNLAPAMHAYRINPITGVEDPNGSVYYFY